jgi:MFS family permease
MRKIHLLFLTILIEGYVVLASELIAMRQLVPFVGSGTEIVAIVISAVLMPLAVGYHFGGTAAARARKENKAYSVRALLIKNILAALMVLGLGLSYVFMEFFFTLMQALGLHHRMLQTTIYSALFLVWPVFLLGQTVPLISHYFSRRNLSEITGHMLFFSTIGSFFGSIFTTLILMSVIGVHNTVIVTMGMLALLIVVLSRRWFTYEIMVAALVMAAVIAMNNNSMMKSLNVVSNNAYNTVMIDKVKDEPNSRILNVNRSSSSKASDDRNNYFAYWKYIQPTFIEPISSGMEPPRDMLIIGAGGFSIGEFDTHNQYTYVDIDPALKKVSEKYFLKKNLTANKQFIPLSARAFLRQDKKQYDFILLDTFTNMISLPMECTTREFLEAVKSRLKPNGIVVANVISSPTFNERFTVRYSNTFASVFPQFTRQVIGDFNAWDMGKDPRTGSTKMSNVLYIYYHRQYVGDDTIYTDDKNTFSLDR